MFFSSKKSVLGIDIGTSNIKIAQITSDNGIHTLDTYGLVNVNFEMDEDRENAIDQTVKVLTSLIEKSGATTKRVVAALPNSSVFTSVIELPALREEEMNSAVEFEAKKYVPLPFSDVTLRWMALDKTADGKNMVLITAVPNVILKNYTRIFQLAKLDIVALEIEALALIRSVIGEDKGNDLLIDIGAKTTHLSITEKGNLVLTRNIPQGGDTITMKIADSLKISMARAEQFKKDFGLNQSSLIPETIKPILTGIKAEVKQLQSIYKARGKNFDKIIIVGGGASLPGLEPFLSDLGPKVTHGDPLSRLTFHEDLRPLLSQYAGNLAVAIGLALRDTK